MKKNLIVVSFILCVSLLLLTACGQVNESKNTNPANSEPVELVVISSSGDSQDLFDQKFGNFLHQKFPNYKITYLPGKSIKDAVAAGQPIDLVYDSVGKTMGGLLQYDLQYDMTDLLKKHNVDLQPLEPSEVDAMKKMSGGGLYGVPVVAEVLVTFYNKDIFDKFGVAYPTNGMTWEQAIGLNKKLTQMADGKQYYGFAAVPDHLLKMNPFSLPFVDSKTETSAMNNEKWKELVQTALIDPALAPGYQNGMSNELKGKLPGAVEFAKSQSLAMFTWLSGFPVSYGADLAQFNWDMVSMPTFSDNPGVGSQAYPYYFSVTKSSKYKDQAMEVIKSLLSEEFQTELSKKGYIPVINNDSVKKVFGQDTLFKNKNVSAIFYNKLAPIMVKTPYDDKVESTLTSAINDLALGKAEINTTLSSAEEAGNKAIQTMKQQ